MKRNLAYCRINHIIDLHRQQRNFLIVGLRIVEHRLEHQHFADTDATSSVVIRVVSFRTPFCRRSW